ncbi:conserved hypothetical protein [Pseudomonas savastanoi pv. phaseolicola 1448A]|uniref:Uncharacterized protein n=3 Tax=Pseudomonas savastanoi TaxID=29438 RepID=A0A3M6EK37_PSESG|nr:conserved hypothetical protein [Pseudomonas savastanoi pv. phaseolicola 1448A]KPB39899.1 Uncharacterized protein AC513_4070 [Pseudomonas savastanoi pv. phaseolicola]KPB66257.1 Uncharacterized protein AC508_2185 [Pseudomonas amygdali pv. mellea]RMM66869.1 hypothetical protein ALQ74_01689 [Pseudomonas savastanoi pv. glycinea]KPB45616.1 Uncharacterized protein AC514_4396 [Pseudomonas savastanoi pv. phaseolicola]
MALISRVREPQAMSEDAQLIDLGAERAKRIHDLNDKRLMSSKKPKKKPKKR